jgi:hypothetical protein
MSYNDYLGLGGSGGSGSSGSSGGSSDNAQPVPPTNGVATTCKVTAVLCFILAFIGGIILADGEDWGIAIAAWTGSFLTCLMLYAVGEIINLLGISAHNSRELGRQNDKIIQALTDAKPQPTKSNVNSNSFEDLPSL